MNSPAKQEATQEQELDERELFNQAIADDVDIPEDEKTAILGDSSNDQDDDRGDEGPDVEGEEQPPAAKSQPGDAGHGDDQQQAEPTGFEWLEKIPEDSRGEVKGFIEKQGQQIARLDQRVKSHLGQLRPAQRMITQLQRENQQLKASQAKSQPGFDVEANIKAYNDKIDKEYSDFPEEAEKLKTLHKESLDGILRVLPAPEKARVPQAPQGPDRSNEIQHLSTAYSDWGERRYSPEFDGWVRTQPQEIQQLLNSPFAADNIALLDAFTQSHPNWEPPQRPQDFYSVHQAQHSPLFRGWAEAEGVNPDMNFGALPDHQRDYLLTRFKADLAAAYAGDDNNAGGDGNHETEQQPSGKAQRLQQRRSQQLRDRDPGSRRTSVAPGQPIDLDTKEGQKALFEQMIRDDPDLRN